MKPRMPFKTIRGQLVAWFLVVATVPLALFAVVTYRQRVAAVKSEAFSKLQAIRDLKTQRITDWLNDISADMEMVSANARAILAAGGGVRPLAGDTTLRALRESFLTYSRFQKTIAEIQLVDPATGRVLISTDGRHEGEDRSTSLSFAEPLKTKKPFVNDIHRSTTTGKRRMDLGTPVVLPGPGAVVLAVVVADVDIQALDRLLGERTGLGDSGETLVVNRDVVALADLRWLPDAPLRLKLSGLPAILASQGKTGVTEAIDYRGVPVLGAYTFIPRTGWGFVAKQDLSELYAPIVKLDRALLVLFPVCLVLVGAMAVAVARYFSRPLLEMQSTVEAVRGGNLAARNQVDWGDELGFLARAFNGMADTVESQMAVAKGHREIMEAMVRPATLDAFCAELLPVIVRATRSDMGAFYLPAPGGKLAPAASIGLSGGALEPFDANHLEGALGAALSSHEVVHLREIPPDTRFTFRTLAGTAIPREMLTIPVVVRGETVALIALASLRDYPPESLGVVQKSLPAFSIGFANIVAGEETRRLAAELSDRNSDLQAQSAELEAQAVELRQQSGILQDQNAELEVQTMRAAEANRLKGEFLSNMSHELRTPLNSVMALSRVLLVKGKGRFTAEEAGYLEIIERNGKHLLALINDILDLAKIESGRMDVFAEEFSLGEKVIALAESLQPICEEKGVHLAVDVEEGLPRLFTDERRVYQILQNIVGNAVKFTPAGRVTVMARRRGDEVEVAVTDTGIGIPEKDLPHIFDEFRQVDGTTARSFEGTGLGLAIAARSARLLGGRIGVESQVGAGSTFTFVLPLHAFCAFPAATGTRAGLVPAMTEELSAGDGRRTVLVVDDDPRDAGLVASFLSGEGYDAVTALSGKEALRLAEVHRPFAITLDVLMPDMDGWEVLEALKRNPVTASTPVIIVSMAEDRETGLALGAIGVVSKPVDRGALMKEVRRVAPSDRASVLVVDDDETDRRLVAGLLASEGLEVNQARDGKECLALVSERLPDVVTLDLVMPGMGGFEVLDNLRRDPLTRGLPVIIVTAHDLSAKERERLKGTVASVVQKSSLASGELLKEIARILERLGKKPAAPRGNRLLLVEDSEPAIVQIRMVLEAAGYRVEVARGGDEALAKMGSPPPDGIILDLMMPGMDGLTLLERMRGTPATARTPVLILTAKDLTSGDLHRLSANNVHQLIQKGDVDREGLLREVGRLLGRERTAPAPVKAIPRRTVPVPRRAGELRRILAVEDNPDSMTTLWAILNEKFTILEARDGAEGLCAARERHPDLILLDMSLPGMDGTALLGRLREDPATREIPVIALTAHAMKGDRERLLAAGCDGYLSKPVDVKQLLETVERWLGPEESPGRG